MLLVVPAIDGIGGEEDGWDADSAGSRCAPEADLEASCPFLSHVPQRLFDRLCEGTDCVLVRIRQLLMSSVPKNPSAVSAARSRSAYVESLQGQLVELGLEK